MNAVNLVGETADQIRYFAHWRFRIQRSGRSAAKNLWLYLLCLF